MTDELTPAEIRAVRAHIRCIARLNTDGVKELLTQNAETLNETATAIKSIQVVLSGLSVLTGWLKALFWWIAGFALIGTLGGLSEPVLRKWFGI